MVSDEAQPFDLHHKDMTLGCIANLTRRLAMLPLRDKVTGSSFDTTRPIHFEDKHGDRFQAMITAIYWNDTTLVLEFTEPEYLGT